MEEEEEEEEEEEGEEEEEELEEEMQRRSNACFQLPPYQVPPEGAPQPLHLATHADVDPKGGHIHLHIARLDPQRKALTLPSTDLVRSTIHPDTQVGSMRMYRCTMTWDGDLDARVQESTRIHNPPPIQCNV